jgi:flagellar biosynthesis/type III secretory pathway protein FliH
MSESYRKGFQDGYKNGIRGEHCKVGSGPLWEILSVADDDKQREYERGYREGYKAGEEDREKIKEE